MGRELKFRAWDPKEKKVFPTVSLNEMMNTGDFWDLEGIIWMQYTGLIDAKGVEVYEGDVLRITNPLTKHSVIKSVWWNGETARFNGVPTSLVNVYEVIGNIYENPELIK